MTPCPAVGRPVLFFIALLSAATSGFAVDLRHRSISSSGQFVVYCDDREARGRTVSFAEEVKAGLLRILREGDEWRLPIVIAIERAADTDAESAPVSITLVNTPAGQKVDVAVRVGDDPAKVFLQRHIVHALLLEMEYRDRPPLRSGGRFARPPWWLTEGILQEIRARAGLRDADIFKSIVDTEKLPSLGKMLSQPPVRIEAAAGAVDRASAYALTTALLRLPSGPANLGRFIRAWPDSAADPLAALAKHFPVLDTSSQSLAKWWTLQLAELGRSETLRGLTAAETDAELTAALTFDIAAGKPPRNERFVIGDFERFIKLPGARPALRLAQVKISGLANRGHALLRPILKEYEDMCGLLAAGKTKGVAERLAQTARFRGAVLQRAGMITDYVNWYEATQTPGSTGQFDRYLRAAESLEKKKTPAVPEDPKIAEYLDSLEQEFAPLRPNMIPGEAPAGASR